MAGPLEAPDKHSAARVTSLWELKLSVAYLCLKAPRTARGVEAESKTLRMFGGRGGRAVSTDPALPSLASGPPACRGGNPFLGWSRQRAGSRVPRWADVGWAGMHMLPRGSIS